MTKARTILPKSEAPELTQTEEPETNMMNTNTVKSTKIRLNVAKGCENFAAPAVLRHGRKYVKSANLSPQEHECD